MGENAYPKHELRGTRYLIVHNTHYRKQEGKCSICGYRVGEVWAFGNAQGTEIPRTRMTKKGPGVLEAV